MNKTETDLPATLRSMLLAAPDTQLDESQKILIQKWSEPPTALQILEVLDNCVHASLGSGFVVKLLQHLYDIACDMQDTTNEEVVKLATWRK